MKAWFIRGTVFPEGEKIDSLYVQQEDWQLYMTEDGGYALAVSEALHSFWVGRGLLEEGLLLPQRAGDGRQCYTICQGEGEWLFSTVYGPYVPVSAAALALGRALKTSRERTSLPLAGGLFLSRLGLVLPVPGKEAAGREEGPDEILGRWICAGMDILLTDTQRIRRYASYLTDPARESLLSMFHLQPGSGGSGSVLTMPRPWREMPGKAPGEEEKGAVPDAAQGSMEPERRPRMEGSFCLHGRPALERFFREEILDVIDREEAYRRFGVGFPGATLLYGPPGSGKTFAVEKLAEYLGWPVYRVTSGTVGSKYVHETSRKISQMFDAAITHAPSVLIIDELETFLAAREETRGSEQTHLEEVGEFLRRIPDAARNRVLLFGMTNMYGQIDQAVLRKGRFDHILEVGMPSAQEVLDVLRSVLSDLPVKKDLRLDRIAGRLAGRPLSDVAFAAAEAGRICVRDGKEAIDEDALEKACDKLAPAGKPKRRIGF